ncbi:hypothetical protein OG216_37045 [Streptomycetaceae bacterium NBC_01309]
MDQQPAPDRPPGRNPWLTTGLTAGVAVALVATLMMSSGEGETVPPGGGVGADMTARPPGLPTDMPSLRPTKPPAPGGTSTRTPSATAPTPSGTKSDWNNAKDDTNPFTAAEWFDKTGSHQIQNRPYTQLSQDKRDCTVAEAGMRPLLGSNCIGIIRSLWTNQAKTHVGSLSVVSLDDKAAATKLAERMSSGGSNGQWVLFITPPSGSGVRFSEQYPTWVSPIASGHYMVVIEVARTDGKAIDATAKTMHSDLKLVATQHINAKTTFGG